MTRLPFLLHDLMREITSIAPNGPAPIITLPAGTFGPIIGELASHYGQPPQSGVTEYKTGGLILRRGE